MKAAVLEAIGKPWVVKEWPQPTCAPDGAIVRVEANGICRSDWHLWMGDMAWVGVKPTLPAVLGHEFCGVVEEVGPQVRSFKPGDRVVIPFSKGCGTCQYCREGHANICDRRPAAAAGGYGRYADIGCADLNLVPLPESIPFTEAASLGCRFMTSFHGIIERARVQPGEWVVVEGCGGIGLAAINIAAGIGARVIGVDLDGRKLELASAMGADHVVNAKGSDPIGTVRDLTGGGAHVSIDALGSAITCRNGIMSLRKRGRHLQIGLTTQAEKGDIPLPTDRMVMMEIQLVGSLGMPAADYPAMLRMVEAGKISPKRMITRTVPLEGVNGVLQEMTNFENFGCTVVDRY